MRQRTLLRGFALMFMLLLVLVPAVAQNVVELRILWYDDGNEGAALRTLLDQFEAENADIRVIIDTIAYADIHTTLQAQVEAGAGAPDMARVTDVARFAGLYLDMSELVADVDYWLTNFPEPVLQSMRTGDDTTGIYGYPTQFTVTGPFINVTLFEQAGVDIPADGSTWEEWVAAAEQVATETGVPYAIAIDRSGHRVWGPALSRCATFANEDGTFTVDSPGFRSTAEMIIDWHTRGITPLEVWAGSGGGYAAANEFFINGELVMYMSGSWQVGQFTQRIGDAFDWRVIPNPSGDCGSTGMPGGAVMVALGGTEHPAEVARVMDYLASTDALRTFSQDSLFIPGHLGLIEEGLEYSASNEALNAFAAEIPKFMPEAYTLQYHPFGFVLNTSIRDRLSQVIVGELTLDEAIVQIQSDVDTAMAEAGS